MFIDCASDTAEIIISESVPVMKMGQVPGSPGREREKHSYIKLIILGSYFRKIIVLDQAFGRSKSLFPWILRSLHENTSQVLDQLLMIGMQHPETNDAWRSCNL